MVKRDVAFAVTLALAGCATIFHGTHEDVSITCDSPTATLRVDGSPAGQGMFLMKRGEDHTVSAEEVGCVPTDVVIRNRVAWGYAILDGVLSVVFFPIGLVAPAVDLVDGAFWDLEPEHVRLPAPRPAPPPPPAHN